MLCMNLLGLKLPEVSKLAEEIFGYFIHSILEMFLGNINIGPKKFIPINLIMF